MNISGIRPEAGFYDNSSINRLSQNSLDSTNTGKNKTNAFDIPAVELELSDSGMKRANQTFGAYDYAAQYKPGESFNMRGENSDIKSLDVERAVSDMQRDSILQQYQFFVGNSNSGFDASQQANEDFTL